MSKRQSLNSILAVILGLIAGAILMLAIGDSPVDGYIYLFKGGLMNIERVGNTLATATPLILTGLSVAFAFKTGLFNIGTPGQMLFGGFCSTIVALTYGGIMPRILLILLILIVGILAGAIWGFIPGILKAKFNVNEVVSSIMMNWISYWLVYYMVPQYFKGSAETESKNILDIASLKTAWLTNLFQDSYINLGIFIAIIAVIIVGFILNKTVLGYQLKAVGFNREAAEYAGMSVNKNIITSMMIAGALSGLAGVSQYLGNATNIQIGIMPSQGFDGIAVSLLGANNPIGVLISAIFFGVLYSGKGFMNANTNIPPEIADTIIATIIYFAAISSVAYSLFKKIIKYKNKREAKKTNFENSIEMENRSNISINTSNSSQELDKGNINSENKEEK